MLILPRFTANGRRQISLAILLVFALVFASGGSAAADEIPPAPPSGLSRGQEAINRLGERLPDVAVAYGLTALDLRGLFLNDHTLHVDGNDELLYVDDPFLGDAAASQAELLAPEEAPFPTEDTFTLHSLPGANHTIYLDFDGHSTPANMGWNSNNSFTSPPYDIDGNPGSFSATEIDRIQKTWQIVAEDFRPFNVDVTTEDPGIEALRNTGGGDTQWGIRVVITQQVWGNCGCGGHAYIDDFSANWDRPAFVYNTSLTGVAEASTHEAGHTLNLSHDGTSSSTYYSGHGSGETSWGPIMGASYNRRMTQWSRGEYYNTNNAGSGANYGNGPDDLVVITTSNGFGYRSDDHGNSNGTATALSVMGNALSGAGIIERTTDVDVFSFSTNAGSVSLNIAPYTLGTEGGSNLDVLAQLYDSGGNLVATSDPAAQIAASVNLSLAAGTYYLHVDGTGTGTPLSSPPTGYTEYGSLGQYSITGTAVDPDPGGSITFAAIGDYGDDTPAEGDVADLVKSWNPEFIITMGDNSYGSTAIDTNVGKYYSEFIYPYSGSYTPAGTAPNKFFPALGNHDYSDGAGVSAYLSYFNLPGADFSNSSGNERYYDFVWGPVHFFAINSNSQEPDGNSSSSTQAQWLQAQLAASTAPWQVVYLHHTPYSSANHGSNTTLQWPYAAWGADAVIAGHDHTYERVERNGIVYFTNGAGGRPLYTCGSLIVGSQICYDGDYGAMRINADSTSMTFEFINRLGTLIDTHTIGTTPPPVGVVDVQISGSIDDVEERASDGVVYTDSTDIELGDDPGFNEDQTVGLLFRNVTVPQGATVTAAYLEFTVDEVDTGITDVTIHAENVDNPVDFVVATNDVTNRATTTASAAWSIPAWDTVGATKQSPDISALVQEVVDRGGWVSGNKMVFIIDGSGSRTAEAYDGSAAEAARLHIEYDATPPPPPAVGIHEAEDAVLSGPVVDNSFAGYSGTGFVDYQNPSADYIEWTVDAASAGQYALRFRYALSSGDRPLQISVNGSVVDPGLSFPSTGSFSTWGVTSDVVATMDAGVNTIRATAVGSSGANVDYLEIDTYAPPNVPPTADAGADQTVGDTNGTAGESVTLDGSGSSDSDGTIVSYAWSWTGGSASGVNPIVSLPDGVTVVTLLVTDDDGATDSDTVSITVTAPPNVPPTADAGADQTVGDTNGTAGELVTLDGSGSSDSDGTIVSYAWTWPGGSASGANPTVSLPDGVTLVTLLVTDDDGATGSDTVSITVVAPPNVPPTASFSFSTADLNVDFTDASTDGDGTVVGWSWDFGDGNTSTVQNPSHTYAAGNTYNVSLTVTDDDGATGNTSQNVTVTAPPAYVDYLATSDIIVAGTVSGSYVNTQADDGVFESIEEIESGGKPVNRYTYLEHKWTFNVPPGGTSTTFFANAWAPASSDNDQFAFYYSTDDTNYTLMFAVADQSDMGNYQTFDLSGLSGTIYIRVIDTDRTSGNRATDTVYVDDLYIRTNNTPVTPPAAPTGLSATAFSSSQIDLNWTDGSSNELGFTIERSPNGVDSWAEVGSVSADITTYSDGGLNPATIYHYRVRAFNSGGESGYSNVANATTSPATFMKVTALNGSSQTVKNKWSATVQINVTELNGTTQVSGATVTGVWSGGGTGTAQCTTGSPGNSPGWCTVTIDNLKNSDSSVTFTVTDVSLVNYIHDAGSSELIITIVRSG